MASDGSETRIDDVLKERGIGLGLEDQRQRIVDEYFDGDSEKYREAARATYEHVRNWLERGNVHHTDLRVLQNHHQATGTGAHIEWSSAPDGPIIATCTMPTGSLVNTLITPDGILSKRVDLPPDSLPDLAAIGAGDATSPGVRDADLVLRAQDYKTVVMPSVMSTVESGVPPEVL